MQVTYNKYYYNIIIDLIDRTDNKVISLNPNLLSLDIYYNYKKYVFPITEVTLSIDLATYNRIKDNDVYIKIKLNKKVMDSLNDTENLLEDITVIDNELFTIINKNTINIINEETEEDMPSFNIKYSLFSVNHLKINKCMFNGNYLNCRLIDVIALVNNINERKLIIEKPINSNVYDQILLLPTNTIAMLNYLQEYYTIYSDNLRLFFDFDIYYIMNSVLSNKTPLETNDYLKVIFDVKTNEIEKRSIPYDCGYKSTTSDFYYIKTNDDNIKIIDDSDIKEELFGTKNIILSKDEDLNINRTNINIDGNIEKIKIYHNKLNSKYIENSFDSTYKKKAIFNFANLDINTFKCNKLFVCNYNDVKYLFKVDDVRFNMSLDKNTGNLNCRGICQFSEN